MKIAITDYDGTLRDLKSGIVPQSNIEAIQRWRKAGNKFGIATGRNISMLDFELKNYDITLDFVVCVNGAVVLDKERNILHSVKIPPSVVKEFIKLPLVTDSDNQIIVFCERKIFSIRPYSEMPIELVPKIPFDELAKREDVVQFGIKFKTAEESLKMKEHLPKIFPMLGGNPNRNYLDINMSGVDKKYGISQLLKIMDWQNCPLFVIGDDSNDLPMIGEYKGYTVKTAAPFMHEAAVKVYDSVGDMLINNL
ncbi:MAG: HAD hydrolase family protein [Selenomonadaceae bacterium]|nr:HAD hydrolase family protein [Selenomonadaceae bacterium]